MLPVQQSNDIFSFDKMPPQLFAPKAIVRQQHQYQSDSDPNAPKWDPNRNTYFRINDNGDRTRCPIKTKDQVETEVERALAKSGGGGVGNLDSIEDIFPNDYKPPETLLTAIKKISKGSTESGTGSNKTVDPLKVTQSCNYTLYTAANPDDKGEIKLDTSKYPKMTIEDAKAIASYTYNGDGGAEIAPFKKINTILRMGNKQKIKESIDMIYMLIKSFRKIPLVRHDILFRGIDGIYIRESGKLINPNNNKLYQPELVYKEGEIVIFDQFTSTSTLRSTLETFLYDEKEKDGTEKKTGTVFKIKGAYGYDLEPFSVFSAESEILLDIESKFRVTKIEENVTWNFTEILEEEKEGAMNVVRTDDTANKGDPDADNIYKVTVIELTYIKDEKLPFQDKIEKMMRREAGGIPNIAEYKRLKAPHAPSEPGDEYMVRSTSSGRAIELNMRTGEIKDIGSTLGLPEGWVEMKENIGGVDVTYYTNGEKKQYERPQMVPHLF